MSRRPIAFYYGAGRVHDLLAYRRVVLQPDVYSPEELLALSHGGTETLAYLSLSQDAGPPAPWHRPERDPDWDSALVHVGHPGWVQHITSQTAGAMANGFTGVFLDTLNVEWTHPEDLPHLTTLIAAVREVAGADAYLLANRGFAMLPRLAELVDGVLFESFSVRWTENGYAPWPADVLEGHARVAERLLGFDVNLYALDYADDSRLAAFAERRAQQFGMTCFVSDRALSQLPPRTTAA